MLTIIILLNLQLPCITQLSFILLFCIFLSRLIMLINSGSHSIPLKCNIGISILYCISLPSYLSWMPLNVYRIRRKAIGNRNAFRKELIQLLQELIFHPLPFKEIVKPGADYIYEPTICPVYAYILYETVFLRVFLQLEARYNCSPCLLLSTHQPVRELWI